MKYYINGSSAITHQKTFKNKGYSGTISKLENDHGIIQPDYKEYIDSKMVRRMSHIIRMSLACGMDCLSQSGMENTDSIIIGTGLGCLTDTEKFLKNFLSLDGLIPPTAFIQSTHNTIAGQLSLFLKNHNYNMTHSQNSVSFEHALLDAMLRLNENDTNVLVGATDETIPLLDSLVDTFELNALKGMLTSGAAIFNLSNKKTEHSLARIVDVEAIYKSRGELNEQISTFTEGHDLDLVLSNTNGLIHKHKQVNYNELFGYLHTASALALHYAVDMIENGMARKVLVVNQVGNNTGLILIEGLET
jgi:3-oxoacyl-[acyl-carrier-protein] synthase II